MSLLPVIGALVGGALSGVVTWRRVSRTMKYRSFNPTIRPEHVAQDDYGAWALGRRKRDRLVRVAIAVVIGAAVGALAATMLGAGFGRR